MNKWKLVINAVGDKDGNKVFFNDKQLNIDYASLDVSQGGIPTLNISLPIRDGVNDIEVNVETVSEVGSHIEAKSGGSVEVDTLAEKKE